MLNDTWTELLLIRAVIIILHSIGPLCTAYTLSLFRRAFLSLRGPSFQAIAYDLLLKLEHPQWLLTAFQTYCAAEAAFFVFFLWYRARLQEEAVHPPLRSAEERKELFDRVRSEIHDPERFLSGWFRGAKIEDIGRDDLKEFLSWAFWEGRTTEGDEEYLEDLTAQVEEMCKRKFKPGRGEAKSLRLTLDPIEIEWRSLVWYTLIMVLDTISHVRLLRYGGKYYWTPKTCVAVFPPRPLAIATATGRSPVKHLSYWLRPHTSKTRLPVLYLHGIGVGLHPHVEFLHELDKGLNAGTSTDDGQVGILSIEVLQISSRLTHSMPTRLEFLDDLARILEKHNFKRFVLLSHSYGSVLSTHVLTHDALASRVSATLLVDPVTILLHMPDVAYNFTIRKPKHANEWQLWYFASKDPGTAYTLGRHFFWSQNVLWRDRIMELVKDQGMRLTASLASRDLIVDTAAVGQYLMKDELSDPVLVTDKTNQQVHMELQGDKKKERKQEWQKREWEGKGLEVLWWDDFDHAQVFDDAKTRAKLVSVLVEYSKGK